MLEGVKLVLAGKCVQAGAKTGKIRDTQVKKKERTIMPDPGAQCLSNSRAHSTLGSASNGCIDLL